MSDVSYILLVEDGETVVTYVRERNGNWVTGGGLYYVCLDEDNDYEDLANNLLVLSQNGVPSNHPLFQKVVQKLAYMSGALIEEVS